MLRLVRLEGTATPGRPPAGKGHILEAHLPSECTLTDAPGRGCPKRESPRDSSPNQKVTQASIQGHANYSFLGERTGHSPELWAGGPPGGPGEEVNPTSALAICLPGVRRRKERSFGPRWSRSSRNSPASTSSRISRARSGVISSNCNFE